MDSRTAGPDLEIKNHGGLGRVRSAPLVRHVQADSRSMRASILLKLDHVTRTAKRARLHAVEEDP